VHILLIKNRLIASLNVFLDVFPVVSIGSGTDSNPHNFADLSCRLRACGGRRRPSALKFPAGRFKFGRLSLGRFNPWPLQSLALIA
jgi:hypothetical protein